MKQERVYFTGFALALTIFYFVSGSYAADSKKLWSHMCASCHNGETATDSESMRVKYRTVDEFAAAVRLRGHRCMNILKNDEALIKKIAREIGLKETNPE